ncbi:MAG TPA: hypothetical protein VFW87_23440, partial [Pirellulales bacterium]|nr:hypothetical protein [Pirellulales bacterium]
MLRDPRVKVWLLQVAVVLLTFWHDAGGAPLVAAPGQIRVLIVDEENDYGKPEYRPYLNTLNSSRVIAYLNAHCAKGADGKTPAWRHWDKDTAIAKEDPEWQGRLDMAKEAMTKAGNTLPVVVLTNGHQTSTMPLPASEDDTLSLLATWGGK